MTGLKVTSLYIFVAATLAFCLLATLFPYCELSVGSSARSWFALVNTHTNAYHMWRIDHVAGAFSALFSTWGAHTFIPVSMAILCLGTYRIMRFLSVATPDLTTDTITSWIVSIGSTLLIVATIGPDAVSLSAIAWLPLVVIALIVLTTVAQAGVALSAAPLWPIALFISIEASTAANQLAPLTALIACIIAHSLMRIENATPQTLRSSIPIWALAIAPAIYASITAPAAPFPIYPDLTSHLVPDDGLVGIVRPLVGPDYPLQVVDRSRVQTLYALPSLVMTAMAIMTLTWVRRRSAKAPIALTSAACVVASIALLDTALPEEFAVISPLMSLSRLLPWGSALSLTPFALAVSAWLLCVGCGAWLRSWRLALLLPLIGVVVLMSAQKAWWVPPLTFADVATISNDESIQRVAISPSLGVLTRYGQSVPLLLMKLSEFKTLSQQSMHSIDQSNVTFKTHPEGRHNDLHRLIDNNPHTRWTGKRTHQLGDEVVTIRFAQPVSLRGLELDPGEYTSDFPRGIRISGGACDKQNSKLLFTLPQWQGALAFTSDGFPYFRPQSDVRILFENAQRVECLFVEQTGSAPFHWSIAELKIL